MSERENKSRDEITADYIASGVSGILGGVIGALGLMTEQNVFSEANPDIPDALGAGLVVLVGVSLIVNGGVRYYFARKASKQQSQGE